MSNQEKASQSSEKERRWQEAAELVDHMADNFEQPVDEGIKEIVVALNTWEINTTGSCEGHMDRGEPAPWIDIEAKEVDVLNEKLKKTKSKKETSRIEEEIERRNLEERRKIINLLDEFYKDRHTPFSQRLVIQGRGQGWSKLESQGADLQKIEPEEVRKRRLQEYREEMRAFADFLKEKFLDGENAAGSTT